MIRSLRPNLTYANVMATIAVFLALGTGVTYAANTVFSGDIVDGEVKTADLGPAAVTNAKLADNSVGKPKISAGAVENGKIADGAVGTAKLGNNAATNAKIADNAVTTQKVQNGTLTGTDVFDNSLTGDDINEASLAGLPFGNANTLDGLDSTDFVHGPGRLGRWAESIGGEGAVYIDPAGRFRVRVNCPLGSVPGTLIFHNRSNLTGNAFAERGMAPGDVSFDEFTAFDDDSSPSEDDEVRVGDLDVLGDRASLSVQFSNGDVVQIDGYYVQRASDCHTQGTVLYSGISEPAP